MTDIELVDVVSRRLCDRCDSFVSIVNGAKVIGYGIRSPLKDEQRLQKEHSADCPIDARPPVCACCGGEFWGVSGRTYCAREFKALRALQPPAAEA